MNRLAVVGVRLKCSHGQAEPKSPLSKPWL